MPLEHRRRTRILNRWTRSPQWGSSLRTWTRPSPTEWAAAWSQLPL